MSHPKDMAELNQRVSAGWRPKFVLFWGHQAAENDRLGHECFSQWYPAPFEVEGMRFPTAEHYMMWRKARLFEDDQTAAAVLAAGSPAAAKKLGRAVRNFSEEVWVQQRFQIVVRASVAKFGRNSELRAYLLGTKDRVLVEASPVDRVWGIGLDAMSEHAKNPLLWRGLNLLGFALMQARTELSLAED